LPLKHRAQEGETGAHLTGPDGKGSSSPLWGSSLKFTPSLFLRKHQANPYQGTFCQIPDHKSSKGSGKSREDGETVTWGPGDMRTKCKMGTCNKGEKNM